MTTVNTLFNSAPMVSEEFAPEELELLNCEVTPEIREILWQMKRERDQEAREEQELMELVEAHREDLRKPDLERKLSNVVELQERMAKGMEMIQELNQEIDTLFEKHYWFVKVYYSWKHQDNLDMLPEVTSHWKKPMTKADGQRFLNDGRNAHHYFKLDKRVRYWKHWNNLKDQCQALIGEDKLVWRQYFDLLNKPITPYWEYGINEEESESADSRMMDTADLYEMTHMIQERKDNYVAVA